MLSERIYCTQSSYPWFVNFIILIFVVYMGLRFWYDYFWSFFDPDYREHYRPFWVCILIQMLFLLVCGEASCLWQLNLRAPENSDQLFKHVLVKYVPFYQIVYGASFLSILVWELTDNWATKSPLRRLIYRFIIAILSFFLFAWAGRVINNGHLPTITSFMLVFFSTVVFIGLNYNTLPSLWALHKKLYQEAEPLFIKIPILYFFYVIFFLATFLLTILTIFDLSVLFFYFAEPLIYDVLLILHSPMYTILYVYPDIDNPQFADTFYPQIVFYKEYWTFFEEYGFLPSPKPVLLTFLEPYCHMKPYSLSFINLFIS